MDTQPLMPKEIHGVSLDEQVAELEDWIKSFKNNGTYTGDTYV